jgi:EAL domain-containing protein (putative c-di-GMP-specific phosphodiesterase class I)/ABC-type nitrate/sulfonate/bicarbonate transport system substrate-binding protein/GGDEF domain-containing protein
VTLIRLYFIPLLALLLSPLLKAEEVSIHLKWYHKFQFAGYYAAKMQGYFAEEGYKVNLIEGGPHKNHLNSLINIETEYAVLGSESLNSLAVDSPIIIVASIFQHAPEVLMTLKSSQANSISDLKDKVIMLADSSISGHIEAMLLKNNLSPDQYQEYSYDGDVTKLISGQVFAMYGYISNEPFQLKQLGYEVDIFKPQQYKINFYGDNLATTQYELDNHPERVAAIRRAVIRGWNYAIAHPDEIIQHIFNRQTNNPAPFNIEHQKYEAKETIKLIDAVNIPLGHSSPDRWAAMIDTYNKVTGAQAIFKPESIYNEFHQDNSWLQVIFIFLSLASGLILALYFWNRTLKNRLDKAVKGLEKAVFEDNLTEMKNRSSLMLFIEECRIKHRNDEYLAILDINGLQKINKEKGFREADQLIINVAKTLKECKFKTSKVYSLYGGKFAVVAKSSRYEEFERKINALIERIIHENAPVILRSGAVQLDLSLDNSSLTTRAELALQHSKDNASTNLVCFDKSFSERIEQKEALLAEVIRGIKKQEFIPYYQPKLNYQTGKIQGVEALVRWDHPTKGILLPGKFLPMVETAPEIMNKLEGAVFEAIMAEAAELIEYFSDTANFRISINLSSIQFNRESLVLDLLAACKRYQVAPRHIEFELTESSMLEDLDTAIEISNQLQAADFKVALDDFGTGYSSLSYIQNLPVNVIKLDYSFVKKIPNDERSGFVVEHIISLAHKLELEIVAEGVEEKEQLDYLGQRNVDLIQGFYFYKPMPLNSICQLEKSLDNYKTIKSKNNL